MSRGIRLISESKRRLTILGVVVIALASTVGAVAYFTSNGTGAAAASTGNLNTPTNVTATATLGSGTVPISWTASDTSDGSVAPQGYYVTRVKNIDNSTAAACGTPSSLITGTSCSDTGVPDGTYHYAVTAVFHSWTATASSNDVTVVNDNTPPYVLTIARVDPTPSKAASVHWTVTFSEGVTGVGSSDFNLVGAGATGAAVSAVSGGGSSYTVTASTGADGSLGLNLTDDDSIRDLANNPLGVSSGAGDGSFTGQTYTIDRTAPTNSLTLNVATGGAFLSGTNTLWFKGNAAGNFMITNAVADAGTGPASSAFPAIGANGMAHSNETVTTPAGGPYTSTAYVWSVSAFSGSHTITSADAVGNTTGTTLTFAVDNTAPVSGVLTPGGVSSGFNTTGSFTIARSDYADAGSGIASSVLVRDEAPLRNNVCGAFSNAQTINGAPATQNGAAGISNGNCYRYTLTGTDHVGNTASVTTTVKVDTAAPTNSLSLTAQTGGSFLDSANSIVFYRGGVGNTGIFRIQNAVADPESGAASSQTATLGALSTGWSHSGSTVSTPAGGPYVSNTFTWATGTTTSPTEVVTGRDVAGNATPAPTLTFKNDNVAPAGGALSVNGGTASSGGTTTFDTDGTFSISALTQYAESASLTASGLASSTLTRDQSTLAANTCGTFGSTTTISGSAPISQGAGDGISTGHCYRYTLTGADDVGNTSAIVTTVKVDTAPPVTTITLSPVAPTGAAGWYKAPAPTFTLAATDAASGVASSQYQIDGGSTVAYGSAVTIPNGSHAITYWSTDNAGNVEGTHTTGTIKVDAAAPTNTLALGGSPVGAFLSGTTLFYKGDAPGSFKLANTVSDSDSGPASATFPAIATTGWTHGAETVSTPLGGSYGSTSYSWTANPTPPGAAGRTFSSTDIAGNTSSGTVLTFTSDVTAPTGGALTANAVAASGGGTSSSNKTGNFAISTSNWAETPSGTQSGLASNALTRAFASFTTPNVCGSFGAATDITGTTIQSGLADGCYLYTFTGTDNVDNAVSSKTTVMVDSLAPAQPTAVTLANGGGSGNSYINITNKSSISVSVTVAEVSTADSVNVTIADGTHTVTKSATVAGATTTVTGIDASTLTDGTGNITVSATESDPAGNSSTSTPAAVTYNKDTVAPTITGVISANKTPGGTAGQAEQGDSITLSFSESILGASVAATSNVVLSAANGNGKPVTLTMPGLSGAFTIGNTTNYLIMNSADVNFNGSPLTQPTAAQVKVTLAAQTGSGTTTVGASQSVVVPASPSLTDIAGNPAAGSFTLAIRFF